MNEQLITMQDIKESKVERKIQIQTQEYVSSFEPLFYVPAFTQKDFHYVHIWPSTKGSPLRNYKYKPGVDNSSSLKHKLLHKRWALSQA